MVLVLFSRRRAIDADEGLLGHVGFAVFIKGILMLHNAEDLGIDDHVIAHPAGGFVGLEVDTAMFVELIEAEDGVLGQVEGDLGLEALDATGLLQGVGVHTVFSGDGAERELNERRSLLTGFARGRRADGEDVWANRAGFGLVNVVGGLVEDGGEVGAIVHGGLCFRLEGTELCGLLGDGFAWLPT